MDAEVTTLVARLLAYQVLRREDPLVLRALTDEAFRQELDTRLAACGLELLDNPYAECVALGLARGQEAAVFETDRESRSNNIGLDRDAVALLVVLWALLILPKRQRQIERARQLQPQGEMFSDERPIPRGQDVSGSVAEVTLLSDFGEKLGKATRIKINLGLLARLGFIVRRNERIYEGPLLDLALDYNRMAGRILDGALKDLLGQRLAEVVPGAQQDV